MEKQRRAERKGDGGEGGGGGGGRVEGDRRRDGSRSEGEECESVIWITDSGLRPVTDKPRHP